MNIRMIDCPRKPKPTRKIEAIRHEALVQLMSETYGLIYAAGWDSESPDKKYISRKHPYMHYRHIIRYMLKHDWPGTTNKQIAAAEQDLFSLPNPIDHTSIMNSVTVVQNVLSKKEVWKKTMAKISFFFELKRGWPEKSDSAISDEFQEYEKLPKHVLSAVLSALTKRNYISKTVLNELIRSYSMLTERDLRQLIETSLDAVRTNYEYSPASRP